MGLDLRDLDSSDEDLASGPSGGCTGEPQQQKYAQTNHVEMDERRLLGMGLHRPSLGTQNSQTSGGGMTSSSEASD